MTATARQSRQGSGGDWRVARQSRAAGGQQPLEKKGAGASVMTDELGAEDGVVGLESAESSLENGDLRWTRDEEGYDGDAGLTSTSRQWRDRQTGEAEEGREGKGKRERGESLLERGLLADDDGYGGTAACNPADDDGTAGKRTMASPTPNALQPCRIGNEREVGEGSGAAVPERNGGRGSSGQRRWAWARATEDEGQRGYRSVRNGKWGRAALPDRKRKGSGGGQRCGVAGTKWGPWEAGSSGQRRWAWARATEDEGQRGYRSI
ncbi:hypothetical protein ACLOJK_039281 [Asimina triloba]